MLSREYVEVDDFIEANERWHDAGWTDGLPIIPPTPELVARFLHAAELEPDAEIGFYSARSRPIFAEVLAVNAVMAGCKPEYFSSIVAIVSGMLDEHFPLHAINASTGSPTLGFVFNGPVPQRLGLGAEGNVLGPGNRASSTIGRAVRLVQINVMGSTPGAGSLRDTPAAPALDRATMGSPAKYTGYHIAENESALRGWDPLHVVRGFDSAESVVTVLPLWGHLALSTHAEQTADEWIESVAHYLVAAGRLEPQGFGCLLLPPESAEVFIEAGWSKRDIQEALYERCRRSAAWVKTNGWKVGGRSGKEVTEADHTTMVSVATSPDDILVVVCGAPTGNFPVFLFAWSGTVPISRAITPPIINAEH